jgi:hypothetical protein
VSGFLFLKSAIIISLILYTLPCSVCVYMLLLAAGHLLLTSGLNLGSVAKEMT